MDQVAKGLLSAVIIIFISFGFGYGVYCLFHYGVDYKERKAEKIEIQVQREALDGNKYAIAILDKTYAIRYKNIPVVLEALKGNPNALEILGIKIKEEGNKH